MLAALPYRERFRRAFGVRAGQRLVLLNSTWNPEGLFGDGGEDVLPSLLPRLTEELPADEYRTAVVLHPNIWHGHGPGQVRRWLDRAERSGMTPVDPLGCWRQALIAADAVIGDFGSVTYYGAALGVPVLLGASTPQVLAPDSPVAAFVREAPVLDADLPLPRQLDALLAGHRPAAGPAALTTSVPGRSAALLRTLCYELMGLAEPDAPAVLDRLPLPAYAPPTRTAPLRVVTEVCGAAEVSLRRYADPRREPDGPGAAHTAVHEDTPDPERLALADVVFREGAADDPRLGPPGAWIDEVLRRHPGCSLAAYVTGAGTCVVGTRDRPPVLLGGDERGVDPAGCASALLGWLSAGGTFEALSGRGLTVRVGGVAHRVSVTPWR